MVSLQGDLCVARPCEVGHQDTGVMQEAAAKAQGKDEESWPTVVETQPDARQPTGKSNHYLTQAPLGCPSKGQLPSI